VGYTPLVLAFLDLWDECASCYCQGASGTLGAFSNVRYTGYGSEKSQSESRKEGPNALNCFLAESVNFPVSGGGGEGEAKPGKPPRALASWPPSRMPTGASLGPDGWLPARGPGSTSSHGW